MYFIIQFLLCIQKSQRFVLRIKNNITLEMLENGKCKIGTGKDAVEVRVVMFCGSTELIMLIIA